MTSLVGALPPGQRIARTVDDPGYPVVVTLVDESAEVVQTAVHSVCHVGGVGLYELVHA